MKRKILALFIVVMIASLAFIAAGCNGNGNTDTTTTPSTSTETTAGGIKIDEYVDTSADKVAERTVNFGNEEKVIKYTKTEDYAELNQKYDVYVNGDDEYRYIFNTDTIDQISIAKFSTAQTAGDAQSLARDFIGSGVKFAVKYQADVTENDYYFKVVFTISDDESLAFLSDPEFKEITAFIPKVSTLATFAFEKG